jgi:arsenite-transporting ATPase
LIAFNPASLSLPKFLFFTGKGGVGKTSVASATAVVLAGQGKRVLIVSTDPASNLDDVFETSLSNDPTPVPGVEGLMGANLDPEEAARQYREKAVGQYRGILPQAALQSIEEQLSGACTVEIAAFDQFTRLMADPEINHRFDHIIFDTAPTGHTLRLMALPKAWTGFIGSNTTGTSCLDPLAALEGKQDFYAKTVAALADQAQTLLVLVARPNPPSLAEAERAAQELKELGVANQVLIINGILEPTTQDQYAQAYSQLQSQALAGAPPGLKEIAWYRLPLVAGQLAGPQGLLALFGQGRPIPETREEAPNLPNLKAVLADLEQNPRGAVLTMGKGGVGKTTLAAAIALSLAQRGKKVHLTTTDPAAHLDMALAGQGAGIKVSRIDPKLETENYRQEVLATVGAGLDKDGLALLAEDLASPCTEEIAVFRAFARVVEEVKEGFVVLDTAPTGHTLLLLDAAQAYHREVARSTGQVPAAVRELLPVLRDPNLTKVLLLTLPEATPVLEARRLQEDLERAGITPAWWLVNQSWQGLDTQEPVLKARAQGEAPWLKRVAEFGKTALIPWQPEPPQGESLLQLTED